MRVTIKWYAIVVTLLFIGQSTLLLVLLQTKHDINASHTQLPVSNGRVNVDKEIVDTEKAKEKCPVVEREPCKPCQPQSKSGAMEERTGEDVEGMAYLYNKFRVAATEVKRQVLKRKGENVPEIPSKIRPNCKSNLVAATYNLWNINPPWPKRLDRIVELIQEVKPHFVGVQEIRKYEGKNQLDILKEKLPDYKHAFYEKVQDEQRGEEEGLGILSIYPILETGSINFGNTNRKCLRALIQTPNGPINFFVTHFSLNDIEQCTHALMLWEHINSFPQDIPQILVGDMNTYFDFEWPMDLLTQGLTPFMLGRLNPCSAVLHKNSNTEVAGYHLLTDTWEELYPSIPKNERIPSSERWWGSWAAPAGHTFSNYADQDPSRTDRLYFYNPSDSKNAKKSTETSSLKLCDVSLFGDTRISDDKVLYPSDHKGVAGYFLMEDK